MARYIKKSEGVYVSQTWVSRLWRDNDLQPWRQGTFKISKDPRFEEKVRDVVGLYLNPPEGEVVVSVDAKSGIQALDRTQPLLPIDFGKTQKRTFDYARMGTTDLYAAMDVRTGKVITSLAQAHATPDFLRLMNKVVAAYDGQKVHVVGDNASVHLSKDTEESLAKQRGRVVFHFTPHRRVVDESDRDLERYHYPEADPVWHVQLREGSQQGDRVVPRALEQRLCAHRMDGHRGRDTRQGPHRHLPYGGPPTRHRDR